jgi:ubiquinone/menaquinone biosynthesis C-methylase UbiE
MENMSFTQRKNQIRSAYCLTGKNSFYDGMITGSTFWGRFVCRLVWDMDAKENDEYLMRALCGIPEGFSGRLLEVPVGTGVLTMPLYRTVPDAEIVCLDYSPNMMDRAEQRARKWQLKNVVFKQGDVGALPFDDSRFDIVLSLNGFHAFPDKDAAYRETFRVLKSGGTFCGCFYVSGLSKRTDFFIRRLYQPLKFFTPPYETIKSLSTRLKGMYEQVELDHIKGIACFVCKKSIYREDS